MRHRQIRGYDPAGLDIDDDAAFGTPLAPAVDHVAAADGGDIFGRAVPHREPIQMTTVLGREL